LKHTTFVASTPRQLVDQIDRALAEGLNPSVALVFASVSLDIASVAQALSAYPFPVFGCSSCGEILVGSEERVEFDGSAVIALLELPPDSARVKLFRSAGESCLSLGRRIGEWGASVFARPAFLVASGGLKRDGEALIHGLISACEPEPPLFGGLAGDDTRFQETFAFTNGEVTSDGVVALVLDHQKIALDGLAASGWAGLGALKTATRSEGNVLFTIDGEPSLEVYKKYLGLSDSDLPAVGLEFPLLVVRSDGTKILRGLMGVDRGQGALVFAGTIPAGAKVQFAVPPGTTMVDVMRGELEGFALRSPAPDLLLVFSCMARRIALGSATEEELQAVRDYWKVPAIGLFTYGEIGRTGDARCDFHNQTCSMVALTAR